MAVALGVSTILPRSAAAFEAIKLCGAAYLGLLGLLALRASFRRSGGDSPSRSAASTPPKFPRLTHPYLQGLLTNVTNPKAIAFFLTFLPQFLGTGPGAVPKALALADHPCRPEPDCG